MLILCDDDHAGCGVFAHVGASEKEGGLNISDLVYTALKDLEYRGYQSAGFVNFGIGPKGEPVPDRFRNVGGADSVKPYIDQHPLVGTLQLGHVRWPTTSPATTANAHPQRVLLRGGKKRLYLVFNGDIHNYRHLDQWLAERFNEELEEARKQGMGDEDAERSIPDLLRPPNIGTDAWTFAAIVNYFYDKEKDLLKAVQRAYPRLDGYFACAVCCEDEPDKVVGAVKGNMPLLVGLSNDPAIGNFLASEPGCFVHHTTRGVSLQSGQIAVITRDNFAVYAFHKEHTEGLRQLTEDELAIKDLNPEEYIYTLDPQYQCFMEQEIFYQPAALAQTICGYLPTVTLSPEEKHLPTARRDQLVRERRRAIAKDLIEGRDVPPSAIDEKREDVLRDMIAGGPSRFSSIKLSDEEICAFQRILGVASGTSGYAIMAMMPSFQAATGLKDDVWTGTKKFDEVRKELRTILKSAFDAASGSGREKQFLRHFSASSPFRTGDFPKVVEAKHLVELIKAFKKVVQDPAFDDVAELNVFRIRLRDASETMGLAVSQSGGTIDTNDVVQIYQAFGVKFISIVNKPGESPLAEKTENDGGLFRTYANIEKGVASSKAHTAQEAAIEELAIYLGLIRKTLSAKRAREKLDALIQVPHLVKEYLENEKNLGQLRKIAEELKAQRYIFFGGRGGLTGTAKEAALKLKELSYIGTEGEDLGEFKHGWRALFPNTADPRLRTYAVCFIADSATHLESLHNLSEIKGSAGTTVVVDFEGPSHSAHSLSDHLIKIPDITDDLAPILSVLPAQLLAYYTTVAIDGVASRIRPLVHELYSYTKIDTEDRFLLEEGALRTLNDTLEILGAQGDLGQLTVDKLDEIKRHIREALNSQSVVDRDIHVANLIREMASENLSVVLFCEDMIKTFSEDLEEDEVTAIMNAFEDVEERTMDIDTKLQLLHDKLGIVLSQSVERGRHFLANSFKTWNETMGIVWFLERDADQPRNLAKVVTVK
ncbi:MAG: SIS domain-containing protein [Candidatus Omnitrophica bacterium]|nr:SIS domain-containing protein [Candidatus Omnitrophota bacterium]